MFKDGFNKSIGFNNDFGQWYVGTDSQQNILQFNTTILGGLCLSLEGE